MVYKLTADGKERLAELLAEAGPAAYDDEGFGVHFAFFAQTDAEVRLKKAKCTQIGRAHV